MLRSTLLAALVAAAQAASLTSLRTTDADLLKEAFFGGECWAIACTDVHDKKTGATLLEKALDDPKVSCRGASLQCGKKLPAGKTPLQRLGIEPPKQKGHPLLILCVNGEARPLNMDEYAKVKENSAAPDARVLSKTLVQAGLAPKPVVVNDDASFNKQCANKRHCLVISFNSTKSDVKAFTRAAAAVAAKRRLLRVVLVDGKHGVLSIQKALPATPATALYARRLNTNEQAALQAISAKVPKAKGSKDELQASACGASAVAGRDVDSAHQNFESKRIGPRDWRSRQDAAGLVFRRGDAYLSYAAVARGLAERELFGSEASYAAAHPLVRLGDTTYTHGAKAFRGDGFDGATLDAWLSQFLAAASDDRAFLQLGLTGLAKRIKFKATSSKRPTPRPRPARRPAPKPRRRGAVEERDRQKERAERERERRERMDAAGADLFETVEVGADGEASVVEEDDDDDDEDDDEDEDVEMI